MDKNDGNLPNNVVNIYSFIALCMEEGDSRETVIQKVMLEGYDEARATEVVDQVVQAVAEHKGKKVTPAVLIMAILGGLAAAIIGGALWYWIIVKADSELGILAWGIGWFCGFAIVFFARGHKGVSLQVAAAGCSIFGILLGKYLAFTYFAYQSVLEQYGQFAADTVTIYSTRVMQVFFSSLGEMLGLYDVLWVVLAVGTAWKIANHNLKELFTRR